MKVNRDYYNRIDPSRIYLATPSKKILCALNGIDINSVDFTGNANDISTLSFDLNRFVDRDNGHHIIANGYNLISKLMKLYVTNIGWFVLNAPETHNDGVKEYLSITANSAQIEFGQVQLDQWKVNRGTTDSLEMLIDGNVEEIDGVEFAKENIKFYNEINPELSLVDILVSKVPGWKVGYIDNIPKTYESYSNGEIITSSILLKDEIGTFDIDYNDCYSFMVKEFEQYFNCIVDFDFLNYEVNFYRVENYGKDTNVTIGFRNVENTNDITIDEDNIFTKFRVSGGEDLGIEQFNGGSSYLLYIDDYWLNNKFLSSSTIKKYKKWKLFTDSARYQYGEYSKEWNRLQEEISELQTRVPTSDVNPENWDTLSDQELLSLKSDYEAQKLGYEKIYVDDEGNFDQSLLDASPDANIYHQIVDSILPNIEIAIANRDLPTSVGEEDYIETYETTWEWYGVNELEIKLQSYQDIVNVLKKSHYDISWEEYQELSKEDSTTYPPLTSDGFEDKHNEYLKNAYQLDESNLDSCAYALKQRKSEVQAKQEEQNEVGTNRTGLAKLMDIETWDGSDDLNKTYVYLVDEHNRILTYNDDALVLPSNTGFGFTTDELDELFYITKLTTYTNENIFVSSTEDIVDTVVLQQKLCETALEDIQVYSIPQTIYTATMDNILSAVGNELHAHDLDYGNFIRLGVRDDYYVKLRVSSISFNPCLYDNNFTIQFSNMIKSGRKRNDFVSLLDMSGNLSQSSASTSYSGDFKLSDDNIYQILTKILQSSSFNNKVQNIVNNNPNYGSGGGSLTVGDIYGNNAFFEYIQSELIAANQIVANSGDFKDLSALVAMIDDLLAGTVSAELGHLIELTAQNVKIDEAVIRDLIAANITVSMLKAGSISADDFNIVSDDGGMSIVGNTMQFKDKNGNIRIQIGRDSNNEFTFVLYDETGKGVLIDSTGIKESAISDGLIKNDMVANGTLSKDKLGFDIVEGDGNGNVDAGKVLIDGHGIDVEFTSVKQTITETNGRIDDLENQIGSIELMGEQIFKSIQGVVTPSSITINAVCRNGVSVGHWYIDDVENTSYVSADKLSITIPSSFMDNKNSCTIKVVDSTGNLYDIQTLYLISDSTGATGQAAISVIITSEYGTVFDEDTDITSTLCICTVYEGVNEIEPNSYNWLSIQNDSDDWTSIGTTKTITLNLNKSKIRTRLKCEVDLDIGGD